MVFFFFAVLCWIREYCPQRQTQVIYEPTVHALLRCPLRMLGRCLVDTQECPVLAAVRLDATLEQVVQGQKCLQAICCVEKRGAKCATLSRSNDDVTAVSQSPYRKPCSVFKTYRSAVTLGCMIHCSRIESCMERNSMIQCW